MKLCRRCRQSRITFLIHRCARCAAIAARLTRRAKSLSDESAARADDSETFERNRLYLRAIRRTLVAGAKDAWQGPR